MARINSPVRWWFVGALAAAAVVGASAQQGPASRQVLISPDNPIWFDSVAQDPTTPAQDPAAAPAAGGRQGGRAGGGLAAPRPYAQVVTAAAKTQKGIFTVHRVADTLLYEIPKAELDKDYLWTTEIKQNVNGTNYGGEAVSNHVVRWQLIGAVGQPSRVVLRTVNYSVIASDKNSPIARAIENANVPPIARSFTVEAFAADGSPVIDTTSLFLSDVPEFSAGRSVGGRAMDATRSFLNKANAYPTNVNVEVTQTYALGGADAGAAAAPAGGRGGGGRGGNSATITTFYSMVKLPEQPMQPRLFDERVGYFSTSTTDYSKDEHKSPRETFITRYRLEKKDPNAAISDPVKPIVYYVDPATPTKWVPWVKRAIEDWQPAFEAAGFSHAIIAREAPTKAEDPDWSIEDARYSVIDWLPSTTENSVGPNVHDPRSGEIINAHVQIYHNVMNLATMWYFTQVGPLDPRALNSRCPTI